MRWQQHSYGWLYKLTLWDNNSIPMSCGWMSRPYEKITSLMPYVCVNKSSLCSNDESISYRYGITIPLMWYDITTVIHISNEWISMPSVWYCNNGYIIQMGYPSIWDNNSMSMSCGWHYNDVIMSVSNHQRLDCLAVCSGVYQRKHQSSVPLAFVRGIQWWPMDSPHKGPVNRKMFPFDDVIMVCKSFVRNIISRYVIWTNSYSAWEIKKIHIIRYARVTRDRT